MNSALLGYTGFVGGNLLESASFTHLFNSKNIHDIKDHEFDFLVCSCIPAEMFVANSNPEQDLKNIQDILDILKTVKAKQAVLVSTIAVYPQPVVTDENSLQFDVNTPYGKHRRYVEEQFAQLFENYLIVRLPALFGYNIKKNFLYDIINPTPAFLKNDKFTEFAEQYSILKEYYQFNESKNMYQFQKQVAIDEDQLSKINYIFSEELDFTSLQFTNADSKFQFYNLRNLHNDIQIALDNNLTTLNVCSTPITPKEVMQRLFNKNFTLTTANKFDYDMKSIHANLWGNEHYLYDKDQVITSLKAFFVENGVL